MCWVYRRQSQGDGNYLYTVGYYAPHPDGREIRMQWESIEDFPKEWMARRLVHYLNGGQTRL